MYENYKPYGREINVEIEKERGLREIARMMKKHNTANTELIFN